VAAGAIALLLLPLAGCGSGNRAASGTAAQLQFGVDMARRGLWREALFRFLQAERLDPDNPRIYNNLAVAYEATGDFDKALEYYQKALRAAPDNRETRGNYARFVEFYQAFRPKPGEGEGSAAAAGAANPNRAASPSPPPPAATPPPPPEPPVIEPAPPAEEPPAGRPR
jgi:tetratricopeptide (TPR) repeat protein